MKLASETQDRLDALVKVLDRYSGRYRERTGTTSLAEYLSVRVCAVSRSRAMNRDAAATAAARMKTPRVQVVDLTQFLCDRRPCYPVIGGALVYKDANHLTTVFATTLGPYLERQVDRLMAGWGKT